MYDFSRCKLCGKEAAAPKYRLKEMTVYACTNCDFHFIDALDDLPTEESRESLLTGKTRQFISSKLLQNSAQLKINLQFVKAHVALAGKHCLDIGSGAGVFPSLLQEEQAIPEGIEPQQVFREYALEKFKLLLRAELVDDPYWQNGYASYFEIITLWDTLEHVNFPVQTIAAAAKLLKPGGYLFLDTPARDSFFYRVSEWSYRLSRSATSPLLETLYSPKPFRHKQIFTKAQLLALLKSAGFSNIEFSAIHRARNKLVLVARKTDH
ncbi:hypothetical protein JCM30471_25160 [Desulfuromonas carbonis]|uniref:class I SAM-dependent methyltransferase n=1 Tax=Desulfuromonas sp. DDH964 TaxID=1823759 RepID=UPI00078DBCAD|nr:class I SAM-dependent methyltransferase [Desulfuromonas sp. DDH964]AMV70522.1 Ubiquinone biosynthesis O-methyltransferase [Desulfuromonas sp. DDH964]